MAILLVWDIYSLFVSLCLACLVGVGTLWAVRWCLSIAGAEEPVSLGELASRTRELAGMALHPAAEELNRASGLILLGVLAAAVASVGLWPYLLVPSLEGWGDLYVLLPLLATPALVAFAASDWQARGKGYGREREALLLAYTAVLLAALCVPAVAARSLWLGQISYPAGRSLPLALSLGGGLGFLVAAVAATVQLALLDTIWDDCLARVSGAVQALLLQVLRGINWFVVISTLTLLFWVFPVNRVLAFVLALPEYVIVLLLMVGLRRALYWPAARSLADIGWLPLGLMALLALALAVGGW